MPLFELPSYVGVTGFKTSAQVRALLPVSRGPRHLMVGVLASQKTIMQGQCDPKDRNADRDRIADIFLPVEGVLNVVHYHTKDTRELWKQLEEALYYGGPYCHGLQMNIMWPQPLVLSRLRYRWPEKCLILQLGGRRWSLTDFTPAVLARRVVAAYADLVDYILLDPSGGLGKGMNIAVIAPYLEALDEEIGQRPVKLVVAGGLDAESLEHIRPLCERFPGLSFDAEGRLHSEGGLSTIRCKRYLMAASDLPV